MPKRKYNQLMSTRTTGRRKYRKVSARRGYSSVPRTRGWVTAPGEMKYYDSELVTTAIPAAGVSFPPGSRLDPSSSINLGGAAVATPLCLFAPQVGAALNQRIGRKVYVHKIKVRGHVYVPQLASGTSEPFRVRLVLLQDKQTNAALYTSTAVFTPATSVDTSISAYQNPNSFGRFRILKDKTMTISNPNFITASTSGQAVQFKFSVRFKKPVLVNFNATTGGTVADIVDNSFHILCGTESATRVPALAYYCRVAYKE